MDLDLDEILDTPVQTSLFIDCFDDLMDSLSGDFPLNGEFDSILADLHESTTTVMTPEPSPLLPGDGVPAKNDYSIGTFLMSNHVRSEDIENMLQLDLLSSTNTDCSQGITMTPTSTSSEQFDAFSGASPLSENYSHDSVNNELFPGNNPLDIVDSSSTQQYNATLQQTEVQESLDQSTPKSVTQQTLVVQSEGQQFEIAISFSLPSNLSTSSSQQPLVAQPLQELGKVIETAHQVQWDLAAQPTAEIVELALNQAQPATIQHDPPRHLKTLVKDNGRRQPVNLDADKSIQANVMKQPTGTNFHDNYQSWLNRVKHFKQIQKTSQPILLRPVTSVPSKEAHWSANQIVVEDQSTTANPASTSINFVHVPSSYIINANGTHKAFVVHEVYKVANPPEESPDEQSQPNRKRPRKSNVVYDTDFQCVPCQKTFGKKGSLKQHIRSYHSEPLPWHCQICGKKFATEQQLQRHVVNHDQANKKFQCSECDKRYVHSKDRDRHFLTHHGVPTHGCGRCNMAFARRDHLLAHEMTHERRQVREVRIQKIRCGEE